MNFGRSLKSLATLCTPTLLVSLLVWSLCDVSVAAVLISAACALLVVLLTDYRLKRAVRLADKAGDLSITLKTVYINIGIRLLALLIFGDSVMHLSAPTSLIALVCVSIALSTICEALSLSSLNSTEEGPAHA